MRVMFYLPVVTPWWFDAIVAPLIRAAAQDAEVSVLVPPLWSSTGIGGAQLTALADLEDIAWYILDGDDHPRLRTSAIDEADLLALVHDISPDFTLCRSADIATPALFPGTVRYIMEGGATPFSTEQSWVYLAPTLFDHGLMPHLGEADAAWLSSVLAPDWHMIQACFPRQGRDNFLAAAGLPADKTLIGLPLEYEHEEMFFAQHNPYRRNIDLVNALAAQIDDDMILAVTNHPLNAVHCDNGPLLDTIASHEGKVRLVPPLGAAGDATLLLTRHGDGIVVGNSKSFGACAFFGTPMLRLSRFATGSWMNAYEAFEPLIAAIRSGTALAAAESDARIWFAYHLLNNAFDPADPALTTKKLIDRMVRPTNDARWGAGLDRYRHRLMRIAA